MYPSPCARPALTPLTIPSHPCPHAQENAELLQTEGNLLAGVQASGDVDYDISAYASRLRSILERKMATTAELLQRVVKFQNHLAIEEEVSRKIDEHTMTRAM